MFMIFLEKLALCGSPSRTRTCDHSINSRMLYQLSYRGSASGGYSKSDAMESAFLPLALGPSGAQPSLMLDPLAFPEFLTPAEMSKADRFAISAGTPGIKLMERAGLAVADEAVRLTKSRGRIAVVCGPGGNGGDGFVAGRLLSERGYAVELGLLGRRDALKGDPALAAARWSGPVLDAGAVDLAQADCVIDALFGAGLARDIDGEAKTIVERINAFKWAGSPVLAVDVPSGIDGETGKIRGALVEATASVTFFRLKPGHLLMPGRMLAGAIRLADIGVPEAALASISPPSLRQCAGRLGRGAAAPERREPQICARRRVHPVGLGPSYGRGPARRPRGFARGRRHCQRGEPVRCGRGQRCAAHRGHGRPLRQRPRI